MAAVAKSLTLTIAVEGGKLQPTYQQKLTIGGFLSGHGEKPIEVKFSRPVKTRSNNQNRYLWGVVYKIISDESGHTPEEIHTAAKQMFLPRKFIMLGNVEIEIEKSTAELSTAEFELYQERVRAWASTELGFRIPLPNDSD
jgi:hypothetical protein